MNYINTLIIQFNNELKKRDITKFRGAVIAALGEDDILFHNHDGEKLRYSYPLIQYKCFRKKANVVCLGKGTEAIASLFNSNKTITIPDYDAPFEIENSRAEKTLVKCWQTPIDYNLYDWIPLNSNNFNIYENTESLKDRIALLEKILVGNILSAMKGLGIDIKEKITCEITKLGKSRPTKYKGIGLMCMDIRFNSNISLPTLMGLGKHASVGYGILTRRVKE